MTEGCRDSWIKLSFHFGFQRVVAFEGHYNQLLSQHEGANTCYSAWDLKFNGGGTSCFTFRLFESRF